VTGGNVSFYNENPTGALFPTPVNGMLALIEYVKQITTSQVKNEGDLVFLVGTNRNEIGGSEYLSSIHGIVGGDAPYIDLEEEKNLHAGVLALIRSGVVESAHDISDGGLAVALAECCITGEPPRGAKITVYDQMRRDALYFGESQSRIVLSCKPGNKREFVQIAMEHELEIQEIGATGGDRLRVNADIDVSIAALSERYYTVLDDIMDRSEPEPV